MVRRLVTVFFAVVLAAVQLLQPVAVYAEALQADSASESSTASGVASASVGAAVSGSGADAGSADKPLVSADDEGSAGSDAASADLSHVEYVYVDRQVVAAGEQQDIAVGLKGLDGGVASAELELRASDGRTVKASAASVSGSAALFTFSFPDADQAASYSVVRVSYRLDGSSEVRGIDLSADQDAGCSFDVVTQDTASVLEASDDDGVSAMVIDQDGSLQAADSVEDALSKADAQGVSESNDEATAPSISQGKGRSAVVRTREDYLVVAIDSGHGSYDSGAVANGVVEKDVNWSIANHFKDELTTYTGVTPFLTTSGEEPGLQARVDRAVAVGADVFVSVHVNSAGASASGAEVWVPRNGSMNNETHTIGQSLGEKIENQLVSLGLHGRGVFTKDYPQGSSGSTYADGSVADYYSVIRNARKHGIPGIIVEHAFVTNSSDAAKLRDDNFRRRLGIADATGVAQQYNLGRDADARAAASVAVRAHVANLGWEGTVYDHKVAGTTGKSLRMEALQVTLLNDAAKSGSVQVQAHVQNIGWQGWTDAGQAAGTTGRGLAIEAVRMRLTGDAADKYDIWYRVHSADFGWSGWAKDGASAGSQGYGKDAQAVEVVLTAKDASAPGSTAAPFRDKADEPLTLSVQGHVHNVGWQGWSSDTAGTTGRSLALEALQVKTEGGNLSGEVETSAHVENVGWMGYVGVGATSGTTGRDLAIQAVRLRLTGELAQQYDIYYRVHVHNIGWLGWAKNGNKAGTEGYGLAAEAVQVRLVEKGTSNAPGPTADAYRAPLVRYLAHVQNVGWQGVMLDGSTAGTTGLNLRMEALHVELGAAAGSGEVEVQAHVQNIGWQGWTTGDAGTTDRSLAIEAVRMRLTGDAADKYDIWYRVHSADFGWLGWARNGDAAGSQGYGRSAQAVEIRLVPKGGGAPGSTSGAFRNDAIMGTSQATVSQLVCAYNASGYNYPAQTYASKGAPSVADFCRIVVDEAGKEGVRAEVVFAQAMHETGWLQFGGSVEAGQCNFAGLGAVSPTEGGASFPSVVIGIRAQVQHLKAYASTEPLNCACVDPRFNLVQRGVAPSLSDLNGRWAVPGTGYGQSIMKIVRRVLGF